MHVQAALAVLLSEVPDPATPAPPVADLLNSVRTLRARLRTMLIALRDGAPLLVAALLLGTLAIWGAACGGRYPLPESPVCDAGAAVADALVPDLAALDALACNPGIGGLPAYCAYTGGAVPTCADCHPPGKDAWCAACAADTTATRVIVCMDGGCTGADCVTCPAVRQ